MARKFFCRNTDAKSIDGVRDLDYIRSSDISDGPLSVQFVWDYQDDTSACNVTFEEVLAAIEGGRPIIATVKIERLFEAEDGTYGDGYELLYKIKKEYKEGTSVADLIRFSSDSVTAGLVSDGSVNVGEVNG
jgi:hypothetical protein